MVERGEWVAPEEGPLICVGENAAVLVLTTGDRCSIGIRLLEDSLRFDELRMPIVTVDGVTVIDEPEPDLEQNATVIFILPDHKVETFTTGRVMEIRVFTADYDEFEGEQFNFHLFHERMELSGLRPLLKQRFPDLDIIDPETGEVL